MYEESSVMKNNRKTAKRCRSNNSSILSRTLTSSSSSSDLGELDSRSQSPIDNRVLDSNDEIDIEKEEQENEEEYVEEDETDLNELPSKSMKFNHQYHYDNNQSGESASSSNTRHVMQHSTPVLRLNNNNENSQNIDNYNKYNHSNMPFMPNNLPMPSPKLYNNNNNKSMQFMSPLANLAEHGHSFNQNNKPISICAVCGDRASGKHYGVLSCDGCRGFFKRSIRGNMDYVCKENNKCIIDVSRRNQCQSCRLKKCLEVKMNKDAVQHQRPPRSYQIRRDLACNSEVAASVLTTTTTNQKFYPSNNKLNQSAFNSNYRFSPFNNMNMNKNNRMESFDTQSPMNAVLMANWNQMPFNSEYLMNSLANSASNYMSSSPAAAAAAAAVTYNNGVKFDNFNFPILNQMNQQLNNCNSKLNNSAFKNVNSFESFNSAKNRSIINSSSASSGYSTSDDNNDSIKTENDSKESVDLTNDNKFETITSNNSNKLNSSASLAHIMNWIKSEPSAENFNELTTRILFAALKWTKTQRNFLNLPINDQILLINDCLGELFVIQMAENKSSLNEIFFLADHDENEEKRKFVQSFQQIIQKFSLFKVDIMEFYLLKSIVLFKSDLKDLQEKQIIESIQEECFNTLFNYNKLNYPNSARFGRLITLYTDIRKYTNKLIDDSFLKNILGKNDISDVLLELNK